MSTTQEKTEEVQENPDIRHFIIPCPVPSCRIEVSIGAMSKHVRNHTLVEVHQGFLASVVDLEWIGKVNSRIKKLSTSNQKQLLVLMTKLNKEQEEALHGH